MRQDIPSSFRRLARQPLLTREEEQALSARHKAGDMSARDELVNRNLRLGLQYARKFSGYGLPFDDAWQAANLGLIQAANRFDPALGRFTTYAVVWIRKEIFYALSKITVVTTPYSRYKNMKRVRRAKEKLLAAGIEPSNEQLAADTGIKPSAVGHSLKASAAWEPATPTDRDDFSWLDSGIQEPWEIAAERERFEKLNSAMRKLPARQRDLLMRRARGDSLNVVGAALDLSKERIRQLEATALENLAKLMGVGAPAVLSMSDPNCHRIEHERGKGGK